MEQRETIIRQIKAQYTLESANYPDFISFIAYAWKTQGVKQAFNNSIDAYLLALGFSQATIDAGYAELAAKRKTLCVR